MLSEWVLWAKGRAVQIDPLATGPKGLFEGISRVTLDS